MVISIEKAFDELDQTWIHQFLHLLAQPLYWNSDVTGGRQTIYSILPENNLKIDWNIRVIRTYTLYKGMIPETEAIKRTVLSFEN